MENTMLIKIRTAERGDRHRKKVCRYYPVDELGLLMADLLGTATISLERLEILRRMGFKITYSGRKDAILEKIGATYEGISFIK